MRISGLISSILLVVSLAGCSPLLKEGIWLQNTPFAAGNVPYVYDTIPSTRIFDFTLVFKKSEVTGIVIIKTEGAGERRIVMTSVFGMTFLDFELKGENIKINYCIEQLNRERVILLLKKDFEILFKPDHSKITRYLYSSPDRLDALEQGNGITKTLMKFTNYNNKWPETMQIEHPYLRLSLLLKKTEYDPESI